MHDYLTIFSEEVVRKLQSRPFRIALIAGVLLLAAITRLPSLLEHLSPSSSQRAIVIGSDGLAENAAAFLKRDFTIAGALAQGSPDATMLKSYNADTAIVLKQSGGSLAAVVYTKHPSATSESTIRRDLLPLALKNVSGLSMKQIKSALDMPVVIRPIASRFGSRGEEEAAAGMASGMLFLLYLAIIMNGQLVMSSAVEEKTSRIAELLIAVVNPSKLLAGKVLAATAVALLQLVVWIAALVFFGAEYRVFRGCCSERLGRRCILCHWKYHAGNHRRVRDILPLWAAASVDAHGGCRIVGEPDRGRWKPGATVIAPDHRRAVHRHRSHPDA